MDMLNSVSATRFDNVNRLAALNQTEEVSGVESEHATAPLASLNSSFLIEISGFGQLLGGLSSLQSSLTALYSPLAFGGATSSNPDVATAVASSAASPGFYTLQVDQLAQAQVLLSAGQASKTAPIGSGAPTTLTFQFGATNNGVFVPNPNQPARSVTIGATNNSLRGIASAINAAGIGVNAFVIADSAGFHLELASATTGAASGMKIGVSGDQALADLLTYNPQGTKALTQLTAPQDAHFTLNGVAGTSPSNSLNGGLPGITLNLTGPGSTTIFVGNQTVPAVSDFSAFITAFNSLNTTLTNLNSSISSLLTSTPFLLNLQARLQGTLTNGAGLAALGISVGANGSLSLNAATLESVLANNPGALAGVFTSGEQPLAVQIASLVQASIFGIVATLQTPQMADQAVALQAQNTVLMNLLVAQHNADLYFLEQLALPTGGQNLGNLLTAQAQLSLLDSMIASGS